MPLDVYLQIHARQMQGFEDEGFLEHDGMEFRDRRADRIDIKGRIRFQGGLFLDVAEVLAVRITRGRKHVRVVRYKYHAGIESPQARSIFRYDNSHSYVREGHPDPHHRHRFDYRTWNELTPPEWIGEDRCPHMSDVIEE